MTTQTKSKAPTAAWTKVHDYRVMVNKGHVCMIADDYSCVVFLYFQADGKPCAIGYKGRAKKPAFHYGYKSSEARELNIDEWMDGISEAKRTAQATERKLKVGDVLYSSWGWEQTNIDFYKVVALKGKQSVEVVEIEGQRTYDGDMSGKTRPLVDEVIGEAFTRRICRHNGAAISINSCAMAWLNEYTETTGGKVYKSHYFSTYA